MFYFNCTRFLLRRGTLYFNIRAWKQAVVQTASDTADARKSFLIGSAVGLDGLELQHLKIKVSSLTGAYCQRLSSSLMVANTILAGRVTSLIRPTFSSASLCAWINKRRENRHFAVGSTFRCLEARAPCSALANKAVTFMPYQLDYMVCILVLRQ